MQGADAIFPCVRALCSVLCEGTNPIPGSAQDLSPQQASGFQQKNLGTQAVSLSQGPSHQGPPGPQNHRPS